MNFSDLLDEDGVSSEENDKIINEIIDYANGDIEIVEDALDYMEENRPEDIPRVAYIFIAIKEVKTNEL